MRAVNLIPGESHHGGISLAAPQAMSYAVIATLAVALAFVTVYVLTGNTISSRRSEVASLQAQIAQVNAEAAALGNYSQVVQLAQQRSQTVSQLAASRFDWPQALSDLSEVVPAGTSLQSLVGTATPDAGTASGGANIGSSALRGDISAPALELTGCTGSQDDVARLMSRLRLMSGVTRVTLANSQKQDSGGGGAPSPRGAGASSGCGANQPTFDLVVFYQPESSPGQSTGAASGSAAGASGASG